MPRLKFEKVLTENPFVDELVYYTKILGYNTVLKDEQQALAAETKESLTAGELYIACYEGKITYEVLDITREVLETTTLNPEMFDQYILNPSSVPKEYQAELQRKAIKHYVETYEEKNDYYRMLNGQPPVGNYGIFVTEEYDYLLPQELVIDLSKPVHKMSDYEINILESYEVLDMMRDDHPELKYLDFLGERKISIYDARVADRFTPLYIAHIESIEVYDKYKDTLFKNRQYILSTVYSEAFKYGSDFYDGFISSLIILQTMTDIIAEVQEFIARKEIFDSRSIKYLLASNNIPYYSEIPMKYQKALVKNLHTLIKYKSTDRNIIDICSLFGFDDIKIFKYYLLKQRLTDEDGNFIFGFREELDEDGMSHYVPDDAVAYDLKFVKVPFDQKADDYIKVEANYETYEEVTENDFFWANEVDAEELKKDIVRQEFTYIRSKYYSIENVYEASRLAFDIPYFYNIIFDNKKLEELLNITVYNINDSVSTFKLSDLFCFMFALTYAYHNIEDDIIAIDQTKSLAVLGFNFKADLEELNRYVISQGFTMEQLGADGFVIPDSSILTMNQLVEIFTNNKKCYDNIVYGLKHAENKRIYEVYKKLYDTLLLTEHTNEFFRMSNGEIPETMTEYLGSRDPALYKTIQSVKDIQDLEQRQKTIVAYITAIVAALEEFLDSDTFKYIYNNIPGVSSEFIKQYIIKLINFFKSYKIDIINFNTIYKLDDKFMNWVKIIDGIEFTVSTTPHDYAIAKDIMIQKINTEYKDHVRPKDKLYIDISTWVYLALRNKTEFDVIDKIYQMIVTLDPKDHMGYRDDIEFYTVKTVNDKVVITPKLEYLTAILHKVDKVLLEDEIATLMYTYDKYDEYRPEDDLEITLTHILASVLKYIDIKRLKVDIHPEEKYKPFEKMYITRTIEQDANSTYN